MLAKNTNRIQIDLTYHSNHIEGGRLTHDQKGFECTGAFLSLY